MLVLQKNVFRSFERSVEEEEKKAMQKQRKKTPSPIDDDDILNFDLMPKEKFKDVVDDEILPADDSDKNR